MVSKVRYLKNMIYLMCVNFVFAPSMLKIFEYASSKSGVGCCTWLLKNTMTKIAKILIFNSFCTTSALP